ncbi:TraB/GumN family protein [Rhizobium sp. RM]|uniref:TraB/GumN family protein n=1 Tax=Rhizobium sp. RM TaxID=2748079 RepID=UPI00110E73B4|nr:TraB/GumN family protein [Rhizobium sp. RM]NWJ23335.1 TraB/GumN family protein [Rhizobium sp. RM]TMV14206.1 polysaccharide biosynthesis protein GumN [Rhizobium sp. Td3]
MHSLNKPQNLTLALMGKAGDAVLWLLALLHVTALAILLMTLLSLGEAEAAPQETSCGGADILVAMQKNDPQRYHAIEQEAAAIPNGKGTFWRIEKSGAEPSYLLGTMHVTDPRVLEMPNGAKEAFEKAGAVIVESDEIVDEQKVAVSLLSKPELTMFLDGKSITDILSPENAARLEKGLKDRGIPLNAVSRMKPWMLSGFVALPACEFTRKAAGASFLDKKLAEDALKNGKRLIGLETMVEQLTAMSELPMEFHLQSLIETLELGDRMDDVMATMTDLYVSGDIGMTMPMLKSLDTKTAGTSEQGYVAFEQRIITDRNHVMAERAAPELEKGNVFMAVGALHLPGSEGVIELLRAQGFKVTRVE